MSTVNREELITALENVSPGLGMGKKDTNDQFLSFVFIDNTVLTYNDEVFISYPLEIPVSGAVRADVLLPFLNRLSDEEIDISQEGDKLLVKTKRTESGIQLQEEISIPLDSMTPPGEWERIPRDFLEALSFCSFSAARDMRKKALTCFHLTEKYVETCDNYRISRWDWKKWKGEALLPARYLKALKNFPFSITHYGFRKGWIYFKGKGQARMACRLESDEFPDLSRFLKVTGTKITLPQGLPEALERAGVFTDEREDQLYVSVLISEKRMEVKGEGPYGYFKEKIPMKYKGPDINFNIEPELLREILTHSKEAVVGDTRIKFQDESFQHVIVLRVGT